MFLKITESESDSNFLFFNSVQPQLFHHFLEVFRIRKPVRTSVVESDRFVVDAAPDDDVVHAVRGRLADGEDEATIERDAKEAETF